MTGLPKNIADNVFVLDPLASVSILRDSKALEKFLSHMDIVLCNIIVFPYNER